MSSPLKESQGPGVDIESDSARQSQQPHLFLDANTTTTAPFEMTDNPMHANKSSLQTKKSTEKKEANEEEHVTECANIYSALMFCLSSSITALYISFAISGDQKISNFWVWIFLPTSLTAMCISFALKPRRVDWQYKVFLWAQYFLFTTCPEILAIVGADDRHEQVLSSLCRCILWFAAIPVLIKYCSRVAELSDKDISVFLTNDVVKSCMLVGLAQLSFLMFGCIQCDGSKDDWQQCNRTLYSQTGLSFMVALYIMIRLSSGIVPRQILEIHNISIRDMVTMRISRLKVSFNPVLFY